MMPGETILRIGSCKSISTPKELQRLKIILDKLEIPYVLDNVSFHNTSYAVQRMQKVYNTRVWKIEKDGSVSLTNRFGHNSRFEYRYLNMPSPIDLEFFDLSELSHDEMEFLSFILFKANVISRPQSTTGL